MVTARRSGSIRSSLETKSAVMGAKKMTSAVRKRLDPELDRLLYIYRTVQSLVQRAGALLDGRRFPKSTRAAARLAKEFERELETKLLRAYDRARS